MLTDHSASWEGSFPLIEDKEEEEEEEELNETGGTEEEEDSPVVKKMREEPQVSSSSIPPPDLPVCAKNISLTASGEKVILWTRCASCEEAQFCSYREQRIMSSLF